MDCNNFNEFQSIIIGDGDDDYGLDGEYSYIRILMYTRAGEKSLVIANYDMDSRKW